MTIDGIEQAIKDMQSGVTCYCVNGECSQCGECCSNLLPMSEKDIKRIEQYIRAHNIKPHSLALFTDNVVDMTCPFLDLTKSKERCTIYPARPDVCRSFICDPTKESLESRKLFNEIVGKGVVMYPIRVRETFFGE